jgi:hypothetical protein
MLLKWLFTILAIIWLYQALRPLLIGYLHRREVPPPRYQAPRQQPPPYRQAPPSRPEVVHRPADDDGDYIDYEEVK